MRREQSFAGGRHDGGVGYDRQSYGRGRPTARVRQRKSVFDCQEGDQQRQRRRRGQKDPRYIHIIICVYTQGHTFTPKGHRSRSFKNIQKPGKSNTNIIYSHFILPIILCDYEN